MTACSTGTMLGVVEKQGGNDSLEELECQSSVDRGGLLRLGGRLNIYTASQSLFFTQDLSCIQFERERWLKPLIVSELHGAL